MESGILRFKIRDSAQKIPESRWRPTGKESRTWNPESTVYNPESNSVLDSPLQAATWAGEIIYPGKNGDLPLVSTSFQMRPMQFSGLCWRSKNETVFSQLLLWATRNDRFSRGGPATTFINQLESAWYRSYKVGSSICCGQRTGIGQTYQMGACARSKSSSCEQSPLLSSWSGSKNEALYESRQVFEVAAARTFGLQWSQSCFLTWNCFFECKHPFIDRPMDIPRARNMCQAHS